MEADHRYNPMEKEYLALVSTIQKMRHYLVDQTTHVISKKVVKGQALINFLADHPVSESSKLYEDLPDEVAEASITQEVIQVWKLFFDRASRENFNGGIIAVVEVVLVSLGGHVIPRGFSLIEPCTNNVAEYNALLLGMQLAKELNIRHLKAYDDSQLIVNQD
ncbi:uncharacterized protein LOC109838221 [Asparagus officinalis]|uniref:uncharacterized protein LOC109838221 n=1 Tax=Asparagus officinalis TaxID=4686 RepID=UPI00098DFFFC|nr:uncharacterized protein LOC109838221 [Asparagus officinalis]